jgi:hypothetical protein
MSKLKKLKNGLRIVVKTAKKNAGDETGALTTIEIVVLLMVVIGVVAIIATWFRGKANKTLQKANEIDNI